MKDNGEQPERRLAILGAFLRRRRETLRPQDVNLPALGRRHVPGLRREEVAGLAGIGASWYTMLEQGHVERVGAKTLQGISEALRLEPHEREYVFDIARERFDVPSAERGPIDGLFALVRAHVTGAAFLMTARSDVLAWNAFADEVFAFATCPERERNMLAMMVRNPRMRFVFPTWAQTLRHMIGVFRANYAATAGSTFDLLAEQLRSESREFASGWKEHGVGTPQAHVCVVRHERLGELRFHFVALVPSDHRAYLLVVLVPTDEASATAAGE